MYRRYTRKQGFQWWTGIAVFVASVFFADTVGVKHARNSEVRRCHFSASSAHKLPRRVMYQCPADSSTSSLALQSRLQRSPFVKNQEKVRVFKGAVYVVTELMSDKQNVANFGCGFSLQPAQGYTLLGEILGAPVYVKVPEIPEQFAEWDSVMAALDHLVEKTSVKDGSVVVSFTQEELAAFASALTWMITTDSNAAVSLARARALAWLAAYRPGETVTNITIAKPAVIDHVVTALQNEVTSQLRATAVPAAGAETPDSAMAVSALRGLYVLAGSVSEHEMPEQYLKNVRFTVEKGPQQGERVQVHVRVANTAEAQVPVEFAAVDRLGQRISISNRLSVPGKKGGQEGEREFTLTCQVPRYQNIHAVRLLNSDGDSVEGTLREELLCVTAILRQMEVIEDKDADEARSNAEKLLADARQTFAVEIVEPEVKKPEPVDAAPPAPRPTVTPAPAPRPVVAAGPVHAIQAVELDGELRPDQRVRAAVTVANNGNTMAFVRCVVVDRAGTEIGRRTPQLRIPAGGEETVTLSWAVPQTFNPAQDGFYIQMLDFTGNPVHTWDVAPPAGAPVWEFSVPASLEARAGEPVDLSVTVSNTGIAEGTLQVAVTLDGEPVDGPQTVTLGPEETSSVSFSLPISVDAPKTMTAVVEISGDALETEQHDVAVAVAPPPAPVWKLAIPARFQGTPGGSVQLAGTVSNTGDAPGDVEVALYQRKRPLGYPRHLHLDQGEKSRFRFNVRIPETAQGELVLTVRLREPGDKKQEIALQNVVIEIADRAAQLQARITAEENPVVLVAMLNTECQTPAERSLVLARLREIAPIVQEAARLYEAANNLMDFSLQYQNLGQLVEDISQLFETANIMMDAALQQPGVVESPGQLLNTANNLIRRMGRARPLVGTEGFANLFATLLVHARQNLALAEVPEHPTRKDFFLAVPLRAHAIFGIRRFENFVDMMPQDRQNTVMTHMGNLRSALDEFLFQAASRATVADLGVWLTEEDIHPAVVRSIVNDQRSRAERNLEEVCILYRSMRESDDVLSTLRRWRAETVRRSTDTTELEAAARRFREVRERALTRIQEILDGLRGQEALAQLRPFLASELSELTALARARVPRTIDEITDLADVRPLMEDESEAVARAARVRVVTETTDIAELESLAGQYPEIAQQSAARAEDVVAGTPHAEALAQLRVLMAEPVSAFRQALVPTVLGQMESVADLTTAVQEFPRIAAQALSRTTQLLADAAGEAALAQLRPLLAAEEESVRGMAAAAVPGVIGRIDDIPVLSALTRDDNEAVARAAQSRVLDVCEPAALPGVLGLHDLRDFHTWLENERVQAHAATREALEVALEQRLLTMVMADLNRALQQPEFALPEAGAPGALPIVTARLVEKLKSLLRPRCPDLRTTAEALRQPECQGPRRTIQLRRANDFVDEVVAGESFRSLAALLEDRMVIPEIPSETMLTYRLTGAVPEIAGERELVRGLVAAVSTIHIEEAAVRELIAAVPAIHADAALTDRLAGVVLEMHDPLGVRVVAEVAAAVGQLSLAQIDTLVEGRGLPKGYKRTRDVLLAEAEARIALLNLREAAEQIATAGVTKKGRIRKMLERQRDAGIRNLAALEEALPYWQDGQTRTQLGKRLSQRIVRLAGTGDLVVVARYAKNDGIRAMCREADAVDPVARRDAMVEALRDSDDLRTIARYAENELVVRVCTVAGLDLAVQRDGLIAGLISPEDVQAVRNEGPVSDELDRLMEERTQQLAEEGAQAQQEDQARLPALFAELVEEPESTERKEELQGIFARNATIALEFLAGNRGEQGYQAAIAVLADGAFMTVDAETEPADMQAGGVSLRSLAARCSTQGQGVVSDIGLTWLDSHWDAQQEAAVAVSVVGHQRVIDHLTARLSEVDRLRGQDHADEAAQVEASYRSGVEVMAETVHITSTMDDRLAAVYRKEQQARLRFDARSGRRNKRAFEKAVAAMNAAEQAMRALLAEAVQMREGSPVSDVRAGDVSLRSLVDTGDRESRASRVALDIQIAWLNTHGDTWEMRLLFALLRHQAVFVSSRDAFVRMLDIPYPAVRDRFFYETIHHRFDAPPVSTSLQPEELIRTIRTAEDYFVRRYAVNQLAYAWRSRLREADALQYLENQVRQAIEREEDVFTRGLLATALYTIHEEDFGEAVNDALKTFIEENSAYVIQAYKLSSQQNLLWHALSSGDEDLADALLGILVNLGGAVDYENPPYVALQDLLQIILNLVWGMYYELETRGEDAGLQPGNGMVMYFLRNAARQLPIGVTLCLVMMPTQLHIFSPVDERGDYRIRFLEELIMQEMRFEGEVREPRSMVGLHLACYRAYRAQAEVYRDSSRTDEELEQLLGHRSHPVRTIARWALTMRLADRLQRAEEAETLAVWAFDRLLDQQRVAHDSLRNPVPHQWRQMLVDIAASPIDGAEEFVQRLMGEYVQVVGLLDRPDDWDPYQIRLAVMLQDMYEKTCGPNKRELERVASETKKQAQRALAAISEGDERRHEFEAYAAATAQLDRLFDENARLTSIIDRHRLRRALGVDETRPQLVTEENYLYRITGDVWNLEDFATLAEWGEQDEDVGAFVAHFRTAAEPYPEVAQAFNNALEKQAEKPVRDAVETACREAQSGQVSEETLRALFALTGDYAEMLLTSHHAGLWASVALMIGGEMQINISKTDYHIPFNEQKLRAVVRALTRQYLASFRAQNRDAQQELLRINFQTLYKSPHWRSLINQAVEDVLAAEGGSRAGAVRSAFAIQPVRSTGPVGLEPLGGADIETLLANAGISLPDGTGGDFEIKLPAERARPQDRQRKQGRRKARKRQPRTADSDALLWDSVRAALAAADQAQRIPVDEQTFIPFFENLRRYAGAALGAPDAARQFWYVIGRNLGVSGAAQIGDDAYDIPYTEEKLEALVRALTVQYLGCLRQKRRDRRAQQLFEEVFRNLYNAAALEIFIQRSREQGDRSLPDAAEIMGIIAAAVNGVLDEQGGRHTQAVRRAFGVREGEGRVPTADAVAASRRLQEQL